MDPIELFLRGLQGRGQFPPPPGSSPSPEPDWAGMERDITAPVGDAGLYPVPDEVNTRQKIFAGLADVLGSYAAGLSGNNALNSYMTERLQAQSERRKETIAANARELRRSEGEGKRDLAKLKYERAIREDDRRKQQADRPFEERSRIVSALRSRGYEIDPDLEAIYLATGDIQQFKPDHTKPYEEATAEAKLGELGVTDLTGDIAGQAYKFADEKSRRSSTPKTPKEDEGKYAGFKTLKELRDAVNDEVTEELKNMEVPTKEMLEGEDELGRPYKRQQVVMRAPTGSIEEARRRVIRRFPGAEQWLPEYAKEPEKKSGISIDDIRAKLKKSH